MSGETANAVKVADVDGEGKGLQEENLLLLYERADVCD